MYDNSRLRREIGQYLNELEGRGLDIRYIDQQRCVLMAFLKHCRAREILNVKRIDSMVILNFLGNYKKRSAGYQAHIQTFLRRFLSYHENPVMMKMRLPIRGTGRIRVDWLTPEETEAVLQTPMTPDQSVLICGGILDGLRQCEILRMTVQDVKNALRTQNLRIRGKGYKERTVPLHQDYGLVLEHYLKYSDPATEDDCLLRFKRCKAEKLLNEFCLRFGRRFTHHTLRRSFGRNLWLLEIPVETIAELLGHSSIDQTKLYLGLSLVDMRQAISRYKVARVCTIETKSGAL